MKRPTRPLAWLVFASLASSAPSLQAAEGDCPTSNGVLTFPNFADLSTFQLNGSTAALGNPVTTENGPVLRLTDNLGQSGSAFLKCPLPLSDATGFKASFSAFFSFRITTPMGISDPDGQGADGIVFVVQTVSNNTGGAGGGIGYSDIPRSLGIEYDTWFNGELGDPNGNHVGIDLGGNITSVQTQLIQKRMNDGDIWYSWVDYDGANQKLEVRLGLDANRPAEPLMTREVNLAEVLQQPDAFIGFTSGTGAAGGRHDILSFAFRNTYDPLPGTTVTNPPPTELLVNVASPLTLNRQTGLFEQTVRVSAGTSSLPPIVRLSVTGLPEGVRLYNATGDVEGVPFVQQGTAAVPPPDGGGDEEGGEATRAKPAGETPGGGAGVDFLMEYFIPNRVIPTTLVYRAAAGSALPDVNPSGRNLQIDRKLLTQDGRLLVEFTTAPGKTYAIQYSSDLASWTTVRPSITAVANRTQWLDDGPPKTASKPSSVESRYYRVVEVAAP